MRRIALSSILCPISYVCTLKSICALFCFVLQSIIGCSWADPPDHSSWSSHSNRISRRSYYHHGLLSARSHVLYDDSTLFATQRLYNDQDSQSRHAFQPSEYIVPTFNHSMTRNRSGGMRGLGLIWKPLEITSDIVLMSISILLPNSSPSSVSLILIHNTQHVEGSSGSIWAFSS
jgi:hypothetical protein